MQMKKSDLKSIVSTPHEEKLSVNISCFTLSIKPKELFFFPTYSTPKVTMLPCYKAKIIKIQNHHFNIHCSLNNLVLIRNTIFIFIKNSKKLCTLASHTMVSREQSFFISADLLFLILIFSSFSCIVFPKDTLDTVETRPTFFCLVFVHIVCQTEVNLDI